MKRISIFIILLILIKGNVQSQTHYIEYGDTNYMAYEKIKKTCVVRGDTIVKHENSIFLTLKDSLEDGYWIVEKKIEKPHCRKFKTYIYMTAIYTNGKRNGPTIYYDIDSKNWPFLSKIQLYQDGERNGMTQIFYYPDFNEIDSEFIPEKCNKDSFLNITYIVFTYPYQNGVKQGWATVQLGPNVFKILYKEGIVIRWEKFRRNKLLSKGNGWPYELNSFYISPCFDL